MDPASTVENTHQARAELGRLQSEFCAKLPWAMRQGDRHEAQSDDRLRGLRFDVPDGTYRLGDSEWLFTVQKGKFAAAARVHVDAEPEGVIHLAEPARPTLPSSVGQTSSIPMERR